jgi:hypothetical protein
LVAKVTQAKPGKIQKSMSPHRSHF